MAVTYLLCTMPVLKQIYIRVLKRVHLCASDLYVILVSRTEV
jgi:hypothetical protein